MQVSAQLLQLKHLINTIDLEQRDRIDLESLLCSLLPDYQFASPSPDPCDNRIALQE
ncbi:hypothetical protein SAMN05880558_11348 [Aeromonas sp. RU39B]|nr:hypothetical protein SAMN05880558_11348 [Aeromonas sp. RU39B]